MTAENKELDNKTTLTMDALTSNEQFPEVQENAIEAVQKKQADDLAALKANEAAAQVHGVKLKKDGTPAKKRGRKSASEGGTVNSAPNNQNKFYDPRVANAPPPGTVAVSSIYAAQVTSGIIEQASVKLISKEFELTPEERAANIEAWKNAFDYSGGVNLTPYQALALSHFAILGTRLAAGNETRSKFALAGAWIKTKWHGWRNKNAHANRGKNAVGKDDIREEKGGEPKKAGTSDNRS